MNDIMAVYKNYAHTYKRELIIGISFLTLFFGTLYFYGYWRDQVEQSAYGDLFDLMQISHSSSKDDAVWKNIEVGAEAGFAQHSNSVLAPYFLAIQAEALVQQEKLTEATAIMDTVVQKISSKSPFYYLYNTKHALLQLSQDASRQNGLAKLEALAQDSTNPQRDMALYQLGNYYFLHDDLAKGNAAWQTLIVAFGQSMLGKSPWAELAQSKLGTLA